VAGETRVANPPTPKQAHRVNEAMQAIQNNDFRKATKLFNQLGKLVHEHPELSRAAGFANLTNGDEVAAQAYLTSSLKQWPEQADVNGALGDIHLKRGDILGSLEYFDAAVTLQPNIFELRYKYGVALLQVQRWEEALWQLHATLRLKPNLTAAKLAVGRALTELNRFDEADQILGEAESAEPHNYAVYFRIAKLREKQLNFDEAMSLLEKAASISNDLAPVCEALGLLELSRSDPEAALTAFRRGLAVSPGDPALLAHISNLRFEMGDPNAFDLYETVLKDARAARVHADYIQRLILAENLPQAADQLDRYQKEVGRDELFLGQKAQLLTAQQDYAGVLKLLANAPDSSQELMTLCAQALLAVDEVPDAEQLLMKLLSRDRMNQFLLALLTTCYRLNKPDEYASLTNYEVLIRSTELEVPAGYQSIEAFNDVLKEKLGSLHVMQHHPLTQSVVGGTQTPGNLLLNPDSVIQSLKEAIHGTLRRELGEQFFSEVPDSSPVNVARGRPYNLQAAWSIWLKAAGYHRPHVHTRGWYSSAYYVSLPGDLTADQGAIAFGRPGVDTPEELAPDLILGPEEGILRLFPSFIWHETLPFSGVEPRVALAFDAVPDFR